MNYIFDKLSENSTWRGLIGVAAALGVAISPEMAEGIIAAGVGLIGLINIIRKEVKS